MKNSSFEKPRPQRLVDVNRATNNLFCQGHILHPVPFAFLFLLILLILSKKISCAFGDISAIFAFDLETGPAKVQKQSDIYASGCQVVHQLYLVCLRQRLDGLIFDKYGVRDHTMSAMKSPTRIPS